ncbi:uncharacterized protein F4822DRAFT_432413 [Hypoxylon trugodes]|uniref:uncharacterized protein n=1 Tax=Hypoxylon trugodes TaxID=326681 RepID=UPI0021A0FAE1|nr:uncharacterized protein F4822DRAFT_432413 [Hypoxylon trugodes]KAI1385560.1 hypothetical protein F4822DRAFT_432413 [Hypoxylon trugodes]
MASIPQIQPINLSAKEIRYIFHHVFLPPLLPQKDDYDVKNEEALLQAIIDSLSAFRGYVQESQSSMADSAHATMERLYQTHDFQLGDTSQINEEQLLNAFESIQNQDVTIPLHVRVQNCGVIFVRSGEAVIVKMFELSALNRDVMSTKGGLRRIFPGSAIKIPMETFRSCQFRATLAGTLAKMSFQEAHGTKPQVRKNGRLQDEDRDTTHPKMVTQLLSSFLLSVGEQVEVVSIWKNTREEVFWQNTKLPFHRSALWMFIRVTLQLEFSEAETRVGYSGQTYKVYMLFFMAYILGRANEIGPASEVLSAMSAKVSRRYQKLFGVVPRRIATFIDSILSVTSNILQKRWSRIMELDNPVKTFKALQSLKFKDDTTMTFPELKIFINSIERRGRNNKPFEFLGNCPLDNYRADMLPDLSMMSDDTPMTYKLAIFEHWVASSLGGWIRSKSAHPATCGVLRRAIEKYHKEALAHYEDNPELTSIMILTILELWVASDRSAVKICSLLREYKPEIPIETLQNLNLPMREQMIRLKNVEEYLASRVSRAGFHMSEVLYHFGSADCFSVRYFNQSFEHQELKARIESRAESERDAKREEFQQKKNEYHEKTQRANQMSHSMVARVNSKGVAFNSCRNNCLKCRLNREAKALTIRIHEWPLPEDELDAKSAVFELQVPPSFGHWRDTLVFIVLDVFKSVYSAENKPRARYELFYASLEDNFREFDSRQRIGLLSEVKPELGTHRRMKTIARHSEDSVCYANALRLQYFDYTSDCFSASISPTMNIPKLCTYSLPRQLAENKSLQQFLHRPAATPDGPMPNQVIATQSACPNGISLEEYKALAVLPLGCLIQWQNVLVQLEMPSVDFKKEETALFISQIIFQAGPRSRNDELGVLRDGHEILNDIHFAEALLGGLGKAIDRVKENWQSFRALGIFVSITRRLLSLTPSADIGQGCLVLLILVRDIALKWIKTLEDQVQRTTDDDIRADLRLKIAKIGLICVDTFEIDDIYLRTVLASQEEACKMIRCFITIQDGLLYIPKKSESLTEIMQRRWERLGYRGFAILANEILVENSSALDDAIKETWTAFRPVNKWVVLPNPYHHWLEGRSIPENESGDRQLVINFSLLTGELLVNGSPLSRLPREYERDSIYSTLFGKSVLEVVPSSVPGMRFSCQKPFSGHELDFGMDHPRRDMLLRAVNEGLVYELVPRYVLQRLLPTIFVEDFVHWYNKTNGYLEFCPRELPWTHSKHNWRLVSSGPAWKLVKDDSYLICNNSPTAREVYKILSLLEEQQWTHIILRGSTLDIELPRLKLGFRLKEGESKVSSRQFRGMSVDEDQSIETLVGLRSKLVLKGDNDQDRRKVILPSGNIGFDKTDQHVHVSIETCPDTKIHVYEIDNLLGRLINNSSLQSRLLISYLHALTSFPLPDPLTGKTGTEQALSILDSAAVRSFKSLTKENFDLLAEIAALTPERVYYPADKQEMQTVSWSPQLGFLAQHGQFYQIVRSIFDQAEESKFLYMESYVDPPLLHNVNQTLLRRDLIRSSTFRVSGFGAEKHTTDHDRAYQSRDRKQYPAQASLSFAMCNVILQGQFSLYEALPNQDLAEYIWEFVDTYAKGELKNRPRHSFQLSSLNYDSRLLLEWAEDVSEDWIRLQQVLSDPSSMKPNKFQVMLWLTTLSFAKNVDVTIIQVLASFFVDIGMCSIFAPPGSVFKLNLGSDIHRYELRRLLGDECFDWDQSPEAALPMKYGEPEYDYEFRRSQRFQDNQKTVIDTLSDALIDQWPCSSPSRPINRGPVEWDRYIDMNAAMTRAHAYFKPRFDNSRFLTYLRYIGNTIPQIIFPIEIPRYSPLVPLESSPNEPGFVSGDDIFSCEAPVKLPPEEDSMEHILSPLNSGSERKPRLPRLLERLAAAARSGYEESYVNDLDSSVQSLQGWKKEYSLASDTQEIGEILSLHRDRCQALVDEIRDIILGAVGADVRAQSATFPHWPRLSPIFFLQGLSRSYGQKLSKDWKNCLVRYGVAVSQLQRAIRALRMVRNPSALINELRNPGHNWQPRDQPESLLLEIESDIMIRPVQEQIAASMINPDRGKNAVMQLNMGEGKSSVIVPMVAAALADGQRLVRVVVGKPQSKQMYQMLVSKLGGLLDRRVYHMPFSRAIKVGHEEVRAMNKLFEDCKENGGVFLVQPEHILSFKLMGIECILTGKEQVGRALVKSQGVLNACTRDIVDESDENFSVKFELVYTMGTQRPTEHSPERWVCIQQVLDIIREVVSEVSPELPSSLEVDTQSPGYFPMTRILQADAADRIFSEVTERICATGLNGFPITRQSERIRQAVRTYISDIEPEAAVIELVEDKDPNGFWASVSQNLLLLRGLIAGGVLMFAFGNKRWRVDYGLDPNRQPATKLAVPYRAKDSPSPRSEFSHPDVVIILTSLSYYYGGLTDEELFQVFSHLLRSDQAELEYQAWLKDAKGLSNGHRQLTGINLEDNECIQQVFKHFRYAKSVIDYFLAHIVFPKEMKEFPHKLSASGWDIGEVKTHPTTGFSGTNDSRKVLPLGVEQPDPDAQKHTNALVLENLLQPENCVELMPSRGEMVGTIAEMLLDTITQMDPPTRVILDVGAQILELDNIGVAKTWLEKTSDNAQIQAAIFFDDNDEICVLDRKGYHEPFQSSPFASQLDVCLVFLDEAHTRGTDLKLPKDYRAAVTLGANLTKDRLVQACMRMRMLGEGQSVVFCVPAEIQKKIQAHGGLPADHEITVLDILAWAIGETWHDIHRSMALWASQGRRHEQHMETWAKAQSNGTIEFSSNLAQEYLEEEARTLEYRYRPHVRQDTNDSDASANGDASDPISLRCNEFKDLKLEAAALQEEEERELSPEIEQEREDQKPPPATPAPHSIHSDVSTFACSGTIVTKTTGYKPAFLALRETGASSHFDVSQFRPGLLVSADFMCTIMRSGLSDKMDLYQRPIQWILTAGSPSTVEHMMVISPFEAQKLLPTIMRSKIVALHLYAPRANLGYRRLDALDLYTVPERLNTRHIPPRLITELNLFAGQLYFDSFEQYVDACKFLGISWDVPGEGEEIAADGFILRDSQGRVGGESGLRNSPVAFFKELHTKIRRNCESIDKTHMGKLLDDQLLKPSDFEN